MEAKYSRCLEMKMDSMIWERKISDFPIFLPLDQFNNIKLFLK